MYLFFQSWLVVLQMSAPAMSLMLLTIWRVRKTNPLGYQMGWGNFFLFILYSLFFALTHRDSMPSRGSMDDLVFEMGILLVITPAHLFIYWISLFMSKPYKKAKQANILASLDDPILDERPPTQ